MYNTYIYYTCNLAKGLVGTQCPTTPRHRIGELLAVLLFGLYFLLGVAIDFLVTVHQKCVIHSLKAGASIVAVLITVIALFVADRFISTNNYTVLIGYALGNGVGTYLGMYISDIVKSRGSFIRKKK